MCFITQQSLEKENSFMFHHTKVIRKRNQLCLSPHKSLDKKRSSFVFHQINVIRKRKKKIKLKGQIPLDKFKLNQKSYYYLQNSVF